MAKTRYCSWLWLAETRKAVQMAFGLLGLAGSLLSCGGRASELDQTGSSHSGGVGSSDTGGAGDSLACARSVDLRDGEVLQSDPLSLQLTGPFEGPEQGNDQGAPVEFGDDVSLPCGLAEPADAPAFRVRFTADDDGVHLFTASETRGTFALLDSDCRTPVVCSIPQFDPQVSTPNRQLYIDLFAGQTVELALQPLPGEPRADISLSVIRLTDYSTGSSDAFHLEDAEITAGSVWGARIDYASNARILAWPPILLRVGSSDNQHPPVDIPITASIPLGHGILTASGVTPAAVSADLAPGSSVNVYLVDPRRADRTSRVLSALVSAPPGVSSTFAYAHCHPELWHCVTGLVCDGFGTFNSRHHPEAVRSCRQ